MTEQRSLNTINKFPTLKEYLLVSQDEVKVEYYQKLIEIWRLKEYHSLEDTLNAFNHKL